MLIVFDTMTHNVERFVGKLSLPEERKIKISDGMRVKEPFILITYTIGFGEVPKRTADFLSDDNNASLMRGVVSSGNRNWGPNFALSGNKISDSFNVPLLMKIELSGTSEDLEKMHKILESME